MAFGLPFGDFFAVAFQFLGRPLLDLPRAVRILHRYGDDAGFFEQLRRVLLTTAFQYWSLHYLPVKQNYNYY